MPIAILKGQCNSEVKCVPIFSANRIIFIEDMPVSHSGRGKHFLEYAQLLEENQDGTNAICYYHEAYQEHAHSWTKKKRLEIAWRAFKLAQFNSNNEYMLYFSRKYYNEIGDSCFAFELFNKKRKFLFEHLDNLHSLGFYDEGLEIISYWINKKTNCLGKDDKVELIIFDDLFREQRFLHFYNYEKDRKTTLEYLDFLNKEIEHVTELKKKLHLSDSEREVNMLIALRHAGIYFLSPDNKKNREEARKIILNNLDCLRFNGTNSTYYKNDKESVSFTDISFLGLAQNKQDSTIINSLKRDKEYIHQTTAKEANKNNFISNLLALSIFYISEDNDESNMLVLENALQRKAVRNYWIKNEFSYPKYLSFERYVKELDKKIIIHKNQTELISNSLANNDYPPKRARQEDDRIPKDKCIFLKGLDYGVPMNLSYNLINCHHTYNHWKIVESPFKNFYFMKDLYREDISETIQSFEEHPILIEEFFGDYMSLIDSSMNYLSEWHYKRTFYQHSIDRRFGSPITSENVYIRDSIETTYFSANDGIFHLTLSYNFEDNLLSKEDKLTSDKLENLIDSIQGLSSSIILEGSHNEITKKRFNSMIYGEVEKEYLLNLYDLMNVYLDYRGSSGCNGANQFLSLLQSLLDSNIPEIDFGTEDILDLAFPYSTECHMYRENYNEINRLMHLLIKKYLPKFDFQNQLTTDFGYWMHMAFTNKNKEVLNFEPSNSEEANYIQDLQREVNYELGNYYPLISKIEKDIFSSRPIVKKVYYQRYTSKIIDFSKIGGAFKHNVEFSKIDSISIYLPNEWDTTSTDVITYKSKIISLSDTNPENIFEGEISGMSSIPYSGGLLDFTLKTNFSNILNNIFYDDSHGALIEFYPMLINSKDPKKGLELIEKSLLHLSYYKENNDDGREANAEKIGLHVASILAYKMQDFEKGNEYYHLARGITPIESQTMFDNDSLSSVYAEMWNGLYFQVHNNQFNPDYYKAISQGSKRKNIVLSKAMKEIQDDLYSQNKWEKILALDEVALKIYNEKGDFKEILDHYLLWFQCVFKSGIEKNIEKRSKEFIEWSRKAEGSEYEKYFYMVEVLNQLITENTEQRKELKKSIVQEKEYSANLVRYSKKIEVLNDSLKTQNNNLNQAMKDKEQALKDKDKALKDKDQALEDLSKEIIKSKELDQQKNFFIILSFILLFAALTSLYRWRKRGEKLTKANQSLSIKNLEIESKSKKLAKQNKFIQKQISDYSHSHTNTLQIISGQLSYLSREKYLNNKEVSEDISKVDKIIMNSKEIYDMLYKKKEEYENMGIFINQLADNRLNQFKARGLEVIKNFKIDENILLKRNIAQSVGMILNEAIRNSCKYAFKESKVQPEISLEYYSEGGLHYIKIQDNGSGFNQDSKVSSMTDGLSLMKQFSEDLLASFHINSKNKTEISLSFNPSLIQGI